MANNSYLNLNQITTDQNFNFLNIISNTDDSEDYSYSPYDNVQYTCNYYDESEFCNLYNNGKKLSICSFNVQSLTSKFQQFSDLINSLNKKSCAPDIICLQEIWKINDDVSFNLNGYQSLIYKQRTILQEVEVSAYA